MKKELDIMNEEFICEVCGEYDVAPSKLVLEAGYGSRYEGSRATLHVCANCIDHLFYALAIDAPILEAIYTLDE